jgi:hypothetical protein
MNLSLQAAVSLSDQNTVSAEPPTPSSLSGKRGELLEFLQKLSPLGRPLRSWPAVAAVAVLACVFLVLIGRAAEKSQVTLLVDMLVADGAWARVSVNDSDVEQYLLPVVPGVRFLYRFPNIPHHLWQLRLRPTEVTDVGVVIYGISLQAGGKEVIRFNPEQIRKWKTLNFSGAEAAPGALALKSTTGYPIFDTKLALSVPESVPLADFWLIQLARPDLLSAVFYGFLLLFILAGCASRVGLSQLLVIVFVHLLGFFAVLRVMKTGSPFSVEATVGGTSFQGYPKSHDYLAALVMLLIAALVGFVTARLVGGVEQPASVEAERRPTGVTYIVHAAIALLLLVLLEPNLAAGLANLQQPQASFTGQWDSSVFYVWQYLVHAGYVPFRDFWYPYAGAYLQLEPFPFGEIAGYLQGATVLFLAYLGLYQLFRRHLRPTLLVFGIILTAVLLGGFEAWWRYMLPLDVILAYLAVNREKRVFQPAHLLLAVSVALAFFYEPAQLMYATGGMLAHTCYRLAARFGGARFRWDWRGIAAEIRMRACYELIPAAAAICVVLGFLATQGMLRGFLAFYAELGTLAKYSASVTNVPNWMNVQVNTLSIFVVTFYLLGLSFQGCIRQPRVYNPAVAICLSLSAVSYLALQKHIMRGPISNQLLVIPALAIVFYAIWRWPRRTVLQTLIVGAFLGGFVGLAILKGVPTQAGRALRASAATLASNYGVVFQQRSSVERAVKNEYSPSRYEYLAKMKVIDILVKDLGFRRPDKIFTLSDDAFFYALLNQDAPYEINAYNSSPIVDQRKVLEWLRRNSPRFVLWDTRQAKFDWVPSSVRIPLIYRYVVRNYAFVQSVDQYQVLRRKSASEGMDLGFWRKELGTPVDLGYIPSLSNPKDYHTCSPGSCGELLQITIPAAPTGSTVVLSVPQQPDLAISFAAISGKRNYFINLERIWFWPAVAAFGTHALQAAPGVDLKILPRNTNGILY